MTIKKCLHRLNFIYLIFQLYHLERYDFEFVVEIGTPPPQTISLVLLTEGDSINFDSYSLEVSSDE